MKFSLTPQPGESGFIQWLDAMKMVAKLQGGIPAEFRRKVLINTYLYYAFQLLCITFDAILLQHNLQGMYNFAVPRY